AVGCPFPKLLRHRHAHVHPPVEPPTTTSTGGTRRWLQQACGLQRRDCPDDVRDTLRERQWLLDVHRQGVWKFFPAIPSPGELCRKCLALATPVTFAARSAL